MNTPDSMCDWQLQHIYCTSCCVNWGVCVVCSDKPSQETEQSPALTVKYIRTILTLCLNCVKRKSSRWQNWTLQENCVESHQPCKFSWIRVNVLCTRPVSERVCTSTRQREIQDWRRKCQRRNWLRTLFCSLYRFSTNHWNDFLETWRTGETRKCFGICKIGCLYLDIFTDFSRFNSWILMIGVYLWDCYLRVAVALAELCFLFQLYFGNLFILLLVLNLYFSHHRAPLCSFSFPTWVGSNYVAAVTGNQPRLFCELAEHLTQTLPTLSPHRGVSCSSLSFTADILCYTYGATAN